MRILPKGKILTVGVPDKQRSAFRKRRCDDLDAVDFFCGADYNHNHRKYIGRVGKNRTLPEKEKIMKQEDMSCIDCAVKNCSKMDKTYPDFCLTTHMDQKVLEEAMACYEQEDVRRIAVAAAEVECEHYCRYTRVEEIMAFAKKIGAHKLGIATCVGLLEESRILARILRRHGFTVYGAACKAGARRKTEIGIPEECCTIGANMCNPVLQAKLLNQAHTDLNIVVGLCVGHDSLFYRYSEAPVTTAVTKDRVLGHNPVAALYTAASYYKRLDTAGEETSDR